MLSQQRVPLSSRQLRSTAKCQEMLSAPASRITSLCPFSLRGIHAAVPKAHLTLRSLAISVPYAKAWFSLSVDPILRPIGFYRI